MVGPSRLAALLALALLMAAPLAAQDETTVPSELSDAEKLYGLALLWQEANYNFAFFDQVPDLDWDDTYQEFIPQVLASESTYDYYRVLRRFLALLEDGHTGVSYPEGLGNRESYPWILVRNIEDRALVVNVGRGLEAGRWRAGIGLRRGAPAPLCFLEHTTPPLGRGATLGATWSCR
jgi:hypothetical protein